MLAKELPEPAPTPLWPLITAQGRVVVALMLREIYTRFGRDNIGFAWIIAEPALFALGVILLWSLSKHSGHAEVAIVPFLLTGYMPLLLFRHMIGRLLRCMQSNSSLLYHRQVTILSLYISRIAVEVLGTSAAFLFCLFAFYMSGHVEIPDDPALMIGAWFLQIWYCSSTSLLLGALSERSELVEKIWSPISYIMIPLSGAFYMLYWMPPMFREVLMWMPPVNVTEMLRGGYFGPSIPTFYDPFYVVYVNCILTVLGLMFVKNARDYVEVE